MSTRNSIQFAILGMVSLRPMTGYEIKQSYERGPANFMPISYGQIYPLLKKLAAEGLVVGKLEAGGRERQRYSITMDGRKLIKAWLTAESGAQVSHKELLLKLFFMTPGELGLIQGQMNGFHKEEAQRLEHYRRARSWLRSEHGDNSRLEIWEMVLDYGVGQSEARVRWSEGILRKMRHGKAKRKASKSA
jgi:PadR family transcriptional regulator, regulatory protein AphA